MTDAGGQRGQGAVRFCPSLGFLRQVPEHACRIEDVGDAQSPWFLFGRPRRANLVAGFQLEPGNRLPPSV